MKKTTEGVKKERKKNYTSISLSPPICSTGRKQAGAAHQPTLRTLLFLTRLPASSCRIMREEKEERVADEDNAKEQGGDKRQPQPQLHVPTRGIPG